MEKWMGWTLLEGISRAIGAGAHDIVGKNSSTTAHAVVNNFIMGAALLISGIIVLCFKRQKIVPKNKKDIFWCCLFGTFAIIATAITITAFRLKAELGLYVFIVSLSIIPGILIDKFAFKDNLTEKQFLGIGIGISAAYTILGFPSLSAILRLPPWIWLGFINIFIVSSNQWITRHIKHMDPFAKNFWVGLFIVISCAIFLIWSGEYGQNLCAKFWIFSSLGALTTISLLTANLMSYKKGGVIAIKNILERGSFLTSALAIGMVFFQEQISQEKIGGVILYVISIYLITKKETKTS